MNRRNLLKTLLGTTVAITIPWTIPVNSWKSLKIRSAELVKKWEPLLRYASNDIKPLHKDKWEDLACLMEYTEQTYLKYKTNTRVLQYLIPAIRRLEGDVKPVAGETYGREYLEFELYMNRQDKGHWLTQPHYSDYYWVELKKDFKTVRCYLT
jgi:hypothetical protein